MHHFALVVYQKLCKIPWNHISLTRLAVEQLTTIPQVHEQRMCVIAIDFHFFKDGELGMEVLIDEFSDFLRRSTFLAEELVAGEGKNLESL